MKYRTIIAIALITMVLLLLGRQAYLYATDSPYRISSQEAKQRIQNGEIDVILDVRTQVERDTMGSYPGSIPVPSADLDAVLPTLIPDKHTRILAYCNTGHRARMATDKLHALGYVNAVYISSTYSSLQ